MDRPLLYALTTVMLGPLVGRRGPLSGGIPTRLAAPSVSADGPIASGTTLTTTLGVWSGADTVVGIWQYSSAGGPFADIPGATALTFAIPGSISGGDRFRYRETATNAEGVSFGVSNLATVAISTPVNTAVPVISSTTVEPGQAITVTNGTWTNSPSGYTRQWQRNGANIVGQTGASYTLVAADDDAAITCEVTATNAGGGTMAESVAAHAKFTPVTATSPVVAQSVEVVSESVAPVFTYADSFTRQWYRNGSLVSGQTSAIYGGVKSASDTFQLRYVATNGAKTVNVNSNTITFTVTVVAPVNSVAPALAVGSVEPGQVVSTSTGTWSNTPTSYTYQWYRGASPIGGATANTYTLQNADNDQSIKCRVTAINAGGSTAADSNSNSVAFTPQLTSAAVIGFSGTLPQLVTPASFLFSDEELHQWLVDGAPVGGQTSESYSGAALGNGESVVLRVTATNSPKSLITNSNTATAPVVSLPVNISPSSISADGPIIPGATLTAVSGTWSGADAVYGRWLITTGGVTETVPGETTTTFVIPESVVEGDLIQYSETGVNFAGDVYADSNALVVAAVTPAPINTEAPAIGYVVNPGDGNITVLSTGIWSLTPTSYAYQWFKNTALEVGEESSEYLGTSSLITGDDIYCEVTAFNAGNASAPAATNIITIGDASLNYSFVDESALEDGYRLEYSEDDLTWLVAATLPPAVGTGTTYNETVGGFDFNTLYYTRVVAFSGPNDTIVQTPYPLYTSPPAAPTACLATPVSDSTVVVDWVLPSLSSRPLTGYRVYGREVGAPAWTSAAVVTDPAVATVDVTGLSPVTSYEFYVVAYNANVGTADAETSATNIAAASTPNETTPPTLELAEIDATGVTLTLTLSESIVFGVDVGVPTLTSSGGVVTASYVSVSGENLVYSLSRPVLGDEVLTLDYIQVGDGVQDLAANLLGTVAGFSVTNGSLLSLEILRQDFESAAAIPGWTLEGTSSVWVSVEGTLAGVNSAYTHTAGRMTPPTFPPTPELWIYGMFTAATTPSSTSRYAVEILDAGGVLLCRWRLGSALLSAIGNGEIYSANSTAIVIDTPYHFWMRYVKGTGANGVAELWISPTAVRGAAIITRTISTGAATADAVKVQFGSITSGSGGKVWDNLIISTADPGDNPFA